MSTRDGAPAVPNDVGTGSEANRVGEYGTHNPNNGGPSVPSNIAPSEPLGDEQIRLATMVLEGPTSRNAISGPITVDLHGSISVPGSAGMASRFTPQDFGQIIGGLSTEAQHDLLSRCSSGTLTSILPHCTGAAHAAVSTQLPMTQAAESAVQLARNSFSALAQMFSGSAPSGTTVSSQSMPSGPERDTGVTPR
jgi:hypothetical protein